MYIFGAALMLQRLNQIKLRYTLNVKTYFTSHILPKIIIIPVFYFAYGLHWSYGIFAVLIFITNVSIIGNTKLKIIDHLYQKSMWKYSLPFVFSGLLFWAISNLDRIYLTFYEANYLAEYGYAISIANLLFFSQIFVTTRWLPSLLKKKEKQIWMEILLLGLGMLILLLCLLQISYLLKTMEVIKIFASIDMPLLAIISCGVCLLAFQEIIGGIDFKNKNSTNLMWSLAAGVSGGASLAAALDSTNLYSGAIIFLSSTAIALVFRILLIVRLVYKHRHGGF